MRRTILRLLPVILLCVCFLSGCGEKAPDGITITCKGEKLTLLELMNGTQQGEITAVITPSDYEGTVTWTSDDAGIVKVIETSGTECTLLAKKTGSTVITAECGGTSASFRVHVLKDQEALTARDTALTIHGVAYSSEMCTICFADLYYDFAEIYGNYAALYGLDTTEGPESLSRQSCSFSSDGTWYGYFLDSAVSMLEETQALCDYAAASGILLTEEETEEIRMELEAESGSAGVQDYLSSRYGTGVTEKLYLQYMENKALADKTYEAYCSALSYSDEELDAHYAELGYAEGENDYPVTAMRHVLIMAEPDDNGEYTDETIAAAHDRAQQIYEEWSSGEQTEDSFAELADACSEDTGSNTAGGLYENIYQGQMVEGINDWLFDESRCPGDTAVIDNNGSYTGTHIVYFVGFGERYNRILARNDLQNTAVSEWFGELLEEYASVQGADYGNIGKF